MKQLACTAIALRALSVAGAFPALGVCAAEPPAVPVPGQVSKATNLESMVDAALADAVKRNGIPPGELSVLSAEAVVWPDGSIGCPQPGMNYTQALVPGYRILIKAGTETLHYHAGRASHATFCPADRAQDPAPYSGAY